MFFISFYGCEYVCISAMIFLISIYGAYTETEVYTYVDYNNLKRMKSS
jgi:hypothetical protein